MGKHSLRSLDPLLGFAYSLNDIPIRSDEEIIPGFVIHGASDCEKTEKLRIVTLGGSTTGPYYEHNWPRALKFLLDNKGIPSIVYNGAVSGYSTNQELLKLIRDVLPLQPDVVLSFNGVNDQGFVHSIRRHPMIHPYSNFVLQTVLSKSIRGKQKGDVINSVNYGPAVETTPAKQWEKNIRLMKAVAAEYSIQYFAYLQPTLGVGVYTHSENEESMLKEYQMMLDEYNQERGSRYLEEIREFYDAAVRITEDYDYITNLVDIFEGARDVYYDPRHPNGKGYSIVAGAIFNDLLDRGVINNKIV